MRILFALAGLHRFDRGAEVALMSVANELARTGDEVTLIGSGRHREGAHYRFVHAGAVARDRFESFPRIPLLRSETGWEELTFAAALLGRYRPADYDLTMTCGYPFTNWALRRPTVGGRRPPHVFVTQNGDWPAYSDDAEYRLFRCEGLVCTNPDYLERNQKRWRCTLIPNGVDLGRFGPGPGDREAFGLPPDRPIVLMVSALIPSKRVGDGIRAVAQVPGAHLVVAGDGPLRDEISALAADLLPGRLTRVSVPADRMPALYRSADAFLHLSREESFGNVFVEALACGLPVVGHDSDRLRWIVGDDEYLLDTSDPARVARSLEQALAAPKEQQAKRLLRASEFSWAKVAGQYRAFFKEVIAAPR